MAAWRLVAAALLAVGLLLGGRHATARAQEQPCARDVSQLGLNPSEAHTATSTGGSAREATQARGRARRYVLQGTRWRARDLWYNVSLYPEGLPREEVDAVLQHAFQLWAGPTTLRFHFAGGGGGGGVGERATGIGPRTPPLRAHIDVRWERGAHGDWDSFDGRGGVLAHAKYPSHGGAVHFDADERWALDEGDAAADRPSLVHIAAHEIGHALGLAHSEARDAVMAPFYGRARARRPLRRLPVDDAAGAAALYGAGALPAARPPSPATQAHRHPLPAQPCSGSLHLDAAFAAPDGFLYMLHGDWLFRHNSRRLEPAAALPLNATWPGLPAGGVDAAFAARSGKLFFFKGSRYWRYSAAGKPPDDGYPRLVRNGFPGAPDAPDAALLWPGNGKLYFFKGEMFWRYDAMPSSSISPPSRRYPRPARVWRGIPVPPDAALSFRGHTYFFKGDLYYRFNDSAFAVEESSPPFPRATAYWWFRCGPRKPSSLRPSPSPASPTSLQPSLPPSPTSLQPSLPPSPTSLQPSLPPPPLPPSASLSSPSLLSTMPTPSSSPPPLSTSSPSPPMSLSSLDLLNEPSSQSDFDNTVDSE